MIVMAKKDMVERVKDIMWKPEKIRNIAIAAHIDHGKTTMTDSLVAGAGMLSEHLAGKARWTDFDEQEQERGITIFSSNVSMVHEVDGEDYLINLIDTPGHVDFGGDVTRAMRAVDGAIILVCAVEGVMPQTETVVRQALKERVKPVLFINKVDRLIKELKLTPEQMQERLMNIIKDVNKLIKKYAEPEFADKWMVRVDNGSVAFGSGYRKWGISVPLMKEWGITFKDIIEYASQDKDEELAKKAPLHKVILDMVVHHLPSPIEAQKYRIEKIWKGDISSKEGQDMVNVNKDGVLAGVVTKVVPDPHAGLVATVRLFSGTVKKGQEVLLVGQHKTQRLQQVSVYKGIQRIQLDEIPAGNVIGLVGLTDAFSGETICDPSHPIEPFESIKHIFEPVVTKSIEPKDPKMLPKFIAFLKQISREDPTFKIEINEETGEYLVSGLGELHIDAKIERPLRDKGIEIKTSNPIVVYTETVSAKSPIIEGKTPNKHNKLYFTVEPLPDEIYQAISEGKIPQNKFKKTPEMVEDLIKNGFSREDAKNLIDIYNKCVLIDSTKGIQYLNETYELIKEGFRNVVDKGPLAGEPSNKILVRLVDAELHEDAIHRGPAQVIPAVRFAIEQAILSAKPSILEPVQVIRIDVPEESMGDVIKEIQSRRGQVMDMTHERGVTVVQAKIPVAEMFGFEATLKSVTGGKGFYSLIDVVFEKLPQELFERTILSIRKRKGMEEKIPKPQVQAE